MIPVSAIKSYAQYNEDIVLLALFPEVKKGFYVDVGANYPTIDSVTKLFYDKGWSGINIEPIKSLYEQLKKERPLDINLHLGVGDKKSELEFFENVTRPGHSSFKSTEAGRDKFDEVQSYKVKVDTLKSILMKNKVKHIHFLKIDVEGFEQSVIVGNDWTLFRPEVICIESNHRSESWKNKLTINKYKLFLNDGLNEYYVAAESWHRTEGFADRVVSLSYNSLRQHHHEGWKEDSKQLKKVTRLNQTHFELLDAVRSENEKLRHGGSLSLEGIGYRERLKRSLKGLTIDWLRYKKHTKDHS
jgi:FkbM family methyltransferase